MSSRPAPPLADVLVVDDALANLQLLAGMLRERGYRVRPVPSGRIALQVAKAQPPDIVLLDVNMPEMNGYEACRRFKADDALKAIPIIFISALSEPFDKLEAFAAGGVDYVTKPFHLDEVRVRIETHVALRGLQIKLEGKNAELAAANDRLVKLEEARRVLSAAIVHDLKGPLAALMGNTQYLMSRQGIDEEVREVLGDMLASSGGMHRMVLNLLDVARMDDAALTPRRESARLAAVVEPVRAAAQIHTRMTGHTVEIDADPEQRVDLDTDLVSRVLENLVDNAIKYAPRGSVVRVVLRGDEGGGLSLRVADSGPGIPLDQRDRIFDRWARLDRDIERRGRASRGLGLAFCRMAVEAHGGRIWVEDNVPSGAVCCAEIPGAPR